ALSDLKEFQTPGGSLPDLGSGPLQTQRHATGHLREKTQPAPGFQPKAQLPAQVAATQGKAEIQLKTLGFVQCDQLGRHCCYHAGRFQELLVFLLQAIQIEQGNAPAFGANLSAQRGEAAIAQKRGVFGLQGLQDLGEAGVVVLFGQCRQNFIDRNQLALWRADGPNERSKQQYGQEDKQNDRDVHWRWPPELRS